MGADTHSGLDSRCLGLAHGHSRTNDLRRPARVSAMVQVAIRCHPRAPTPAEEFASWLEREVADLRAEAPQGTVRLSSLTQHLPNTDVDIGWLLELEVPDDDPLQGRRL